MGGQNDKLKEQINEAKNKIAKGFQMQVFQII